MSDGDDLKSKNLNELFTLLNRNTFSPRAIKCVVDEIMNKKPDMEERAEKVAQKANLRAARERFAYFEKTTAFYNEGMIAPIVNEIKAHLDDVGVDYSALDKFGESTSEEMERILGDAAGRANFIVECRRLVYADLRDNGFDPEMEDPIVNRIVKIIEEDRMEHEVSLINPDFSFASTERMKSVVGQHARVASYIFAQEKLERMESETEILGETMVDSVFEQIRDHLKYAYSNCPDVGVPILFIGEETKAVDARVDAAECRARFINTCGELFCSGDISWIGGNKVEAMQMSGSLWEELVSHKYKGFSLDPEKYSSDYVIDLVDRINIDRFLDVDSSKKPVCG